MAIRGIWEKLLALLIGFLLWNYVVSQGSVEAVFDVPVEVKNLPKDFIIEGLPKTVKVRVIGPPWVVKEVGPGEIKVEVTLDGVTEGLREVSLRSVKVPNGLRVVSVQPASARVRLMRVVEKEVPVVVKWSRKPPFKWKVVPSFVKVMGSKKVVAKVRYVRTQLLDPSLFRDTGSYDVYLEVKDRLKVYPSKVTVEVVR